MNLKLVLKGKKYMGYGTDADGLQLLQSKCSFLKPPSTPTLGGLFICSVDKGESPVEEVTAEPFQEFPQWGGFCFQVS